VFSYSLPNIESVEVLDQYFELDKSFSLSEYTGKSFGVFLEEPIETQWRFSPYAAPHAREYFFHPSQSFNLEKDGSLIVTLKAGGLLEMAWHLLQWGEDVEVWSPPELVKMVNPYRRKWRGLP